MEVKNSRPFSLQGPVAFQIRSVVFLLWATLSVFLSRIIRGPKVPGWSSSFQIANKFLGMQNHHAFRMENIDDARVYFDSLVFFSPSLAEIGMERVGGRTEGIWFYPPHHAGKKRVLYFHGGGYAYFARSHLSFIATIAMSCEVPLFALDYPLIPEYPYPFQLNSALDAYKWLLDTGHAANNIILMGDSAGGNLGLSLVQKLRLVGLPLPGAVIALCPWTDVANSGESMSRNEPFDWVDKRMADQWAEWFLAGQDPKDRLISPIHADLRDLPPIYVQAGGKEILFDMIKEFYDRAISQGAVIELDVWESMTHDFQAYGEFLKEAQEALARVSQFVHSNENTT